MSLSKNINIYKLHDINKKRTKIIDEIKFELQYGILGKLFEGYACGQLQKTFGYRRIATTKALENN